MIQEGSDYVLKAHPLTTSIDLFLEKRGAMMHTCSGSVSYGRTELPAQT